MKTIRKILLFGGIFAIIFGLLIIILFQFKPQKNTSTTSTAIIDNNTPVSPTISYKQIEINQLSYAYKIIKIIPNQNVELIPNFKSKLSSTKLINDHQCESAINGGFYDKNSKPLGLFYSQKTKLGYAITNPTFNGYLWKVNNIEFNIDYSPLNGDTDWVLQTGPILIYEGKPLELKIKNDENARRIIAATSVNNDLFFIVVYDPNQSIYGPLLSDTPRFIQKISDTEFLHIANAVNLDGGSASFFYQPNFSLIEITFPGSIICIK